MSEAIQLEIDDHGDIVIPAEIQERLGLMQGMTLIAEGGEQGQLHLRVQRALPQVKEEEGVLIVTSPLSSDFESPDLWTSSLIDAIREHRERRLADLWQNKEQ